MAIDKLLQKSINDWFYGDRNYREGIALLQEAAPNLRSMIKNLSRREESVETKEHLAYQLFKISDHTDEKICRNKPVEKTPAFKEEKLTAEEGLKVIAEVDNFDFTPKSKEDKLFLAKIIEKQKVIYNKRAEFHKEMVALGDSNTDDIIAKRVNLLTQIALCTNIVNFLHNEKVNWKQSGNKPDESILLHNPVEEVKIEKAAAIKVDDIPEIDLQNELAKVRSRLSKYPEKLKKFSGVKLEELKAKKADDEKLKKEITAKLNALRGR